MIPELNFDEVGGVLKIKFTESWTEEDIPEFFTRLRKLLDGKEHRFIIGDISEAVQQKYSKRFRELIADEAASLDLGKVAIVGANSVLGMMAKVLLSVIGRKLPLEAEFFSTEDEALVWFSEEKEEVPHG